MIPIPVSIKDIIKVCVSITVTIAHCLSAAKDKQKLFQVLTRLTGVVSLLASNMEQYILHPDQMNVWYTSIEMCRVVVSKLGKILVPAPSGMSFYERVKYATWSGGRAERKIGRLEQQVVSLGSLNML